MKMRAMTAAAVMSLAMTCACGGQYEAPTTTHAKPPAAEAAPLVSASSAAASPIASPPIVEARVEARVDKLSPTRALATHLVVKRLVVAHSVKDHEPVFPDTTFKVADAGRIYAFVEIENDEKAPGEVFVSFEAAEGAAAAKGRAPRGDVKLAVGTSPRWRTWAFTRAAKDVGAWVAVVRGANGEVLARAPFEVTL